MIARIPLAFFLLAAAATAYGQDADTDDVELPASSGLRNPEMIASRINAQMRRLTNRGSANAGQSAPEQRQVVVKIDDAAVREAKARGVPISINVCSVVAQSGPTAPPALQSNQTNIACTVQGLGG